MIEKNVEEPNRNPKVEGIKQKILTTGSKNQQTLRQINCVFQFMEQKRRERMKKSEESLKNTKYTNMHNGMSEVEEEKKGQEEYLKK